MTTAFIWLKCKPCAVIWETQVAAPCWLCGEPGEKTYHPTLGPGVMNIREENYPR